MLMNERGQQNERNPKKPQVKKTLQEVGVSSTESRDAFMNVDELRSESTGNV